MCSDRRADLFLGGAINKWLRIIPRVNQGPENPQVIHVNHVKEIDKHLEIFIVLLPLCIKRRQMFNASFIYIVILWHCIHGL
jgi:hypothetical protein